MKIQVKIMPKEEYNEYNLGWSKPVDIDEFILNPNYVEFKWEDDLTLSYKDFIFFGNEYYYGIFINGKNINKLKYSDNKDEFCNLFLSEMQELEQLQKCDKNTKN